MGVSPAKRGVNGPLLNKDFYGFDRPRGLFSNMPLGCEPDWVVFFEDFIGTAQDQTNDWEVVKDAGASVALAEAANGTCLISSAATTDDDGGSIQLGQCPFLLVAGTDIWFEANIKVSDADQCDMFVGLAETFATNPENAWAAGCARVGFQLTDGAADIYCVTDNDTATTTSDSGVDAADATFIKLGFRLDGGYVRYYINRALVASLALPTAIAAIAMSPAFAGISGNTTGTHTRSIDYFMVVKER